MILKDGARESYREQRKGQSARAQTSILLAYLFQQLAREGSSTPDFSQEDFKVGRTMVFCRSEQHQQLELLFTEAVAIVAETIQYAGRVLIAKKICAAKVERSNSFKTILNQAAKCSDVKSLVEILEPAYTKLVDPKEQVQECTYQAQPCFAYLQFLRLQAVGVWSCRPESIVVCKFASKRWQVRVVSEEALAAIKGMSENQLESSRGRLREPVDLVEKIKSTYEEAKKLVRKLHEMKEEMLRFASENPVELSAQKCQLKTKLSASICVSNDLLIRVLRSIPVGGKVVFCHVWQRVSI